LNHSGNSLLILVLILIYASAPARVLSQMPEAEQLVWLDSHRLALMKEISLVGGHSVANLLRGGQGVSYTTLVGILSHASFFGEGSLAGQALRMGSATAMTDWAAVLRIETKAMM
jgi:hypothetical protein